MGKESFDKKIEAVEALRSEAESASTPELLRKALKDRNNFVVSKAAAVVGDLRLQALAPDLITAFDRFLTNAEKSDPQCWAKNAIAKALKDLEHDEPEAFLKGLKHVQMEPVWGGRSDTAGTLRATCVLALAGCKLDGLAVLSYMAEGLADSETLVRISAARGIEQLSSPEGVRCCG